MSRARFVAVAAVCAASPAAAAEGGDGHVADLLWSALNLAILLGVLVALARKPIRAFFRDRRDAIRDELTEAARLRDEAEARFHQWQRRIADLEGELEQIRGTARERAETERDHLLEEARRSAERIRTDALAAIEQELQRSRAQLRDEASDLAIELAAKLLRSEVKEADRKRLVDEFVERIGES